ncbi:MAG: glycosyltransferase [Planctomycetota bacterium]
MNILCNLPLECFEPREALGHRLVTYGPPDRMWIAGTFFPFDVAFDPARGSIHELLARLPSDFTPDLLLLWWPDQEPLPEQLEECPCPVVGVVSDYNLTLQHHVGLWPFFDVVLLDRPGVPLFQRLGFTDVREFCQYSFKAPWHYPHPGERRDIDIAFCGNLNPRVQRERMPWIERLRRLEERGVSVAVASGVHGADYGRLLSRAKLGFNRSIRGEANLRAFEVPACGAVLLNERDNTEIRDFFSPGEECALYGEDDFEDVVLELLRDAPRRERLARAGYERVQREHRMRHRLDTLEKLLQRPGPGRPASTPAERALGRGTAMLSTWARGAPALGGLLEAARLAPDDPRPLNALALARLYCSDDDSANSALELLQRARALAPAYLPAIQNLVQVLETAGHAELAQRLRDDLEQRHADVRDWRDVDGPVFPLGFSESAIQCAAALRTAVEAGTPSAFALHT